MAVASYNELARTYENELGGAPKAIRTWAVTLTNNTLANNPVTHNDILVALSLTNYGASHPDFANPWFGLRKITITERFQDSPYHVQVVGEYGVVSGNDLLNPTSRTPEWSFESQPSQVAALYYWDGSTRKPLVNSAYDYFEGLTTDEQLVRATVRKNFEELPQSQIAATNKINSGLYLDCPANTWKCAGVKTSYVQEIYNGVEHKYWATECELLYRQSSWNLFLPDVGWNYLQGGQKRRAMVFDFENGEWVASANPVALDGAGNQTLGLPAILGGVSGRRIHEEANFEALFGSPPT